MTKYFMSYSTANDEHYKDDLFNFLNLSVHPPGVDEVLLYVAVSEVNQATERDQKFIRRLSAIAEKNKSVRIRLINMKSNIGRDFSSAAFNLRLISREASDEDFILFVNRSGFGPLSGGWYRQYLEQYGRHEGVRICGSTINFLGHPRGKNHTGCTHVQTFAFLSQLKYMKMFLDYYPAEDKTERMDVIDHGEIALSQRLIESGGALTCLAWPDFKFDRAVQNSPELPFSDIKSKVFGLPFLYKRKSLQGRLFFLKYLLWRLGFSVT